jgi:uncharacterized protein
VFPLLVRPTRIVEYVTDINLEELWEEGVRGFIFDLDNTIMAPHAGVLEDHIADWLKKIENMGFKSIIVSNNPIKMYTQEVEKLLKIPVLGSAAKPRRKSLYKALEMLKLQPHEVVVVGDRPLTDIWGGQRLGSKTILVDPLTKHKEHPFIKLLRRLERMFVHALPDNKPHIKQ